MIQKRIALTTSDELFDVSQAFDRMLEISNYFN